MLEEGARVLERALAEVAARPPTQADAAARTPSTALRDTGRPAAGPAARPAPSPRCARELAARPLRDCVSPSAAYPLLVERERALYGAWYEIFPRSEGATCDPDDRAVDVRARSRTAAERLPAIAGMGFDVVYLTPIHPIGTINRKGPNNTLDAGPHDPGSPVRHRLAPTAATTPSTPTSARSTTSTRSSPRPSELGLEVALDLALQCCARPPLGARPTPSGSPPAPTAPSPTPRTRRRSTRTSTRSTSTTTPQGIYAEVRRVVQVWIDHGVKIFRVDNPHTKPVEFWQWLIADVAADHPEVIWLAEAFTRPAMMHTLGKVGFQQSYTYYAWRNAEVGARGVPAEELAGEAAAYMRPVVLADDARHPHALHAVRRPGRLEAARRAGRDAGRRPTASTPATS